MKYLQIVSHLAQSSKYFVNLIKKTKEFQSIAYFMSFFKNKFSHLTRIIWNFDEGMNFFIHNSKYFSKFRLSLCYSIYFISNFCVCNAYLDNDIYKKSSFFFFFLIFPIYWFYQKIVHSLFAYELSSVLFIKSVWGDTIHKCHI